MITATPCGIRTSSTTRRSSTLSSLSATRLARSSVPCTSQPHWPSRYYRVIANVKQNPVPVPLAEPPLVLTHKDLVNQIFTAAYSPLQNYPLVAATIRAIETANQTALAALAPLIVSPIACNCSASPTALPDNDYEAFSGVACGDTDADPHASESFDRAAFQAFFANLTRVAPTAGPV